MIGRAPLLASCFGILALARVSYDHWVAPNQTPAHPRMPLAELGVRELSTGHTGRDVPLEARTIEVAGVDDWVNRYYESPGGFFWFYCGFVSGWRPEAIHYPDVCFPAQGLSLQRKGEVAVEIPGAPGARFHEYQWANAAGEPTYTLSTFLYRGHFEPVETRMRLESGLGIRYFAMVTISGPVRGSPASTRELFAKALGEILPALLDLMPEP
jgi:hypothetical protein